MAAKRSRTTERVLYGIGEWYGKSFVNLSAEERRFYAQLQQIQPKRLRPVQACIPRSDDEVTMPCTKEGGVCSLRLYRREGENGSVSPAAGLAGDPCTTCPFRFYERQQVFNWIGNTILGHEHPLVVGEVGFLEREEPSVDIQDDKPLREDVGRIDHVLVHPDLQHLQWCALEMQAVYFSGEKMSKDFTALLDHPDEHLPFPAGRRHPDYRSSGPKRLMPQLQIKVPTLRRWGKKMCVLVDRSFFHSLGKMDGVREVSNCDIAWFVVRYSEDETGFHLLPDFVHFTTLERAVEGLTAGNPVSLPMFEERIRRKLARHLGGQPVE